MLNKLLIREWYRLAGRPIYLFMMVIAPLFCWLFFADLLKAGVPSELPIAVVDQDQSSTSRALARSLDAFQHVKVSLRTADFSLAREAMQEGKIYGIFLIPSDFKQKASSQEEPVLSFYTNDSYILPGSLTYKDMKTQAALANGAIQQALLLAKGGAEPIVSAKLSPITVDIHPLNNPWLSYSIYLSNILVPAFLCMFVMFVTVFSIGEELKRGTVPEWLAMSGNSVVKAVCSKLLAQLFLWLVVGTFYLVLLYRFLHFPINSGFFPMFLAMVFLVLASQGFALFITGLYKRNRLALSTCALWGVLAFSITGFTFPVRSMPWGMQIFSTFFPMRHYFLIYVDQALNGIPFLYSWPSYMALVIFMLLPLLSFKKLELLLRTNQYWN